MLGHISATLATNSSAAIWSLPWQQQSLSTPIYTCLTLHKTASKLASMARIEITITVAVASTLLSPLVGAQAPAPSVAPAAVWTNTSDSLGRLCSSQGGLQTALQGAASDQDSAGLNITIPASLASAASLQQVAQVNCC